MAGRDINQRLSAELAARLALQMSVSSLPVVDETMDNALGRWLDGVPLGPEMPDREPVPVVVSVGADAQLMRWSAAGAPAGVVPKLTEYLRLAGGVPGDFARVDRIGQALEPEKVGTWIAVRPGQVTTGWCFAGRLLPGPAAEALGEGDWLDGLGAAGVLWIARGLGADAPSWVVVELAGGDREERLAAARAAFARAGLAFDDAVAALVPPSGTPAVASQPDYRMPAAAEAGALMLGARARGGAVEALTLVLLGPEPRALDALCAVAGQELSPQVAAVAQAIGARQPAAVEITRAVGGGAEVVAHFESGSGRGPAESQAN